MLAFTHDVANIAEHEQISGYRASEACRVLSLSGDEPGGKSLRQSVKGIFPSDRVGNPRSQAFGKGRIPGRRELGKTFSEIDIAGSQRRLGLPLQQAGIIPQRGIEMEIRQGHGVAIGSENRNCVLGARPQHDASDGACRSPRQSCRYPPPLHQ
ncbi:MAG: hypothetical protein ACTHNN_17675 [Xanthobacteraceae bacterium]